MSRDWSSSAVPPPPPADRNAADAWVTSPSGERFWGLHGAAGLLAHDPHRGVLLQHRAPWSHHGGTWGIPGGARHRAEDAVTAALREAAEEAAVPADAVVPRATTVVDRQVWTYTTVVAQVVADFTPVPDGAETMALAWVDLDEVDTLDLHPGFAAAWPQLRHAVGVEPVIVVDGANVVGSRPDGWWRDRRGAAARLGEAVATLVRVGVPASALDLPLDRWIPTVHLILEGQARGAQVPEGVHVTGAPAEGDEAIVEAARGHVDRGAYVVVVTSDRALRARAEALGAQVRRAGWLLDLLDTSPGVSRGE